MLSIVLAFAGSATDASVTVVGGTTEQREMARWAIGRFQATGFVLPRTEIQFHADREGCRGRLGYYADGVASVCGIHTDALASRRLLHEIAHGWLESNVTAHERDRFLLLRGLSTWNGQAVEWDGRGFEHAAEIIAWAIGDQSDGIRAPSIPKNAPEELAAAYQMLTGDSLPVIEPWMDWGGETRS